MKLTPTDQITLENVKKSDYWELISIIVWNHYKDKKYQDESMISFEEHWCGVSPIETSYNQKWNDPSHKELGYIRSLYCIAILLKRSDYLTRISIYKDSGNVFIVGKYTRNDIKSSPYYSYGTVDVCNWMLKNGFLKIENH